MSVNSVIFANTQAYAALGSMLTAERYQRLLDCENTAELKKCLLEFSYEGKSIDEMFYNALNGMYNYLNANSPVEAVRLALVKKNDYHNAKVMAKCKYTRREITPELLYPYGDVNTEKMKDWVLNDDYALLPPPMSEALNEIDLRFSKGERNGKLIDELLTRAMYKDIFATLGGKYGDMKAVFQAEVDFANMSVALRARKNALPESALKEEFIAGGKLDYEKVSALYSGTEETLVNVLRGTPYREQAIEALREMEKDALLDYEREADDFIIDLLKPYKKENGSYMLFYGYVLARLYELKNVRIVCGGVKAGAPKDEIRAKLRKLYV